jgi:O-antigen/teichoic acid export membrane protein
VIASVVSRVMAFVMSVVVVRALGDESFGRFGIVSGTLTTFSVIATLGMGVAATKLVAQNRISDPVRAGRSLASAVTAALAMGWILALGLALSAPWLAVHVLGDAGLTWALRLCAAALFFIAWSSAQAGGLAGIEAFPTSAKVSMLGGAVIFVFSVVGVSGWGFLGAVAAIPLGNAAQCLVQEVALRRAYRRASIPFTYARPLSEMRVVLAVGVPAMLSAAVYLPATWLGSVILVRHAGYQQMAVFAIADQWSNLVLMLPMVLGSVLLPVMTSVFSASDDEGSRSLLRRTFLGNLGISLVPLVAIAPFGFLILRIYGPSYAASWPVFSIMVSAACLFAALAPIGHALTATGRMWLGSAMNLGWAVVHLTLAYLLVARGGQGALGLALARLLAYGAHAVWSLAYLRWALRGGSGGLQIRI